MKLIAFATVALLVGVYIPANAQTTITLVSFGVSLEGDTVLLNFVLNDTVSITDDTPCFLNKLIFVSSASVSRRITPMFNGTCEPAIQSSMIMARLDIRDFSAAIAERIFLTVPATFVMTEPGMVENFLPAVNLIPITVPFQVSEVTNHVELPEVTGFDVDLVTNRIFIHFTDIMDLGRFVSTRFTLHGGDGLSAPSLSLSSQSTPIGISNSNIKTICVTMSNVDVEQLYRTSICTSSTKRCYCSYTGQLGYSYTGMDVLASTTRLQVTKLRTQPPSSAPRIYMQLSLSYIDCATTHNLTTDEVYIVRRGEFVQSVSCYSDADRDNTWPKITYGVYNNMVTPSGLTRSSNSSMFSSVNGLAKNMFGLYTCATAGFSVQHYIVNNVSPFLGLPNGPSYSARFYDSLTIPFLFGSNPQINITDQGIEIRMNQVTGSARKEPTEYRRISQYRGEVFYDVAPFSISQQFTLTVIVPGTSPRTTLWISVRDPEVTVTPSAVALLPNDTQAIICCMISNSRLQVYWVSGSLDSQRILTNNPNFTLMVPDGGIPDETKYFCVVRDPESSNNMVTDVSTVLTNIPEPLSVYSNGEVAMDKSEIVIFNRFSGDISLQCLGHAPSNIVNLVWISEEMGGSPEVLQPSMNNERIQVIYSYNEANITVVNSIEPYRGTLRCQSLASGRQATFYVVQRSTDNTTTGCPGKDVDPIWGITWAQTRTESRDSQPCPQINGSITTGFAFRRCNSNGEWARDVDVSKCRSELFDDISDMAEIYFRNFDILTPEDRISSVEMLINSLMNATEPRNVSLYPQELNVTNILTDQIISRLTDLNTLQSYSNLDVFEVFDNLLSATNTAGWRELNRVDVDGGARSLLRNIEVFFGKYLMLTTVEERSGLLKGENLHMTLEEISGSNYVDVIFPNSSDPKAEEAQVLLPASILMEREVQASTIASIRNIGTFFPTPAPMDNCTKVTEAGSTLLTFQLYPLSPRMGFNSGAIWLKYQTNRMIRASNPRCAYWDVTSDSWDTSVVKTTSVKKVEIGEYKIFEVECSSNRTDAHLVLVDVPENVVRFEVTAPVYVGSGFILFFAVMTMFLLLTSSFVGGERSYYVSAYLVHLSFCSSLICAFIVLLAGITLGIGNTAGCVATSVLLHYFFTTAFAWLLCESLILVAFQWVSTNWWSFFVFFLIGWGLPVIPVVISLGVLRENYISTTHCWFFFDGESGANIFLAFIIPKLFIVASILVCLLVSCVTTCKLRSRNIKGQSYLHIYMLFISWFGVFLILLLLTGSWVFLMLHVNKYALSSSLSAWVFAGISIALAIWLFAFSIVLVILNQNIKHQELWAVIDGTKTVKRSKKQKGEPDYQLGDYSSAPGKSDIPSAPPVWQENPASNPTDGDDPEKTYTQID